MYEHTSSIWNSQQLILWKVLGSSSKYISTKKKLFVGIALSWKKRFGHWPRLPPTPDSGGSISTQWAKSKFKKGQKCWKGLYVHTNIKRKFFFIDSIQWVLKSRNFFYNISAVNIGRYLGLVLFFILQFNVHPKDSKYGFEVCHMISRTKLAIHDCIFFSLGNLIHGPKNWI